MADGKRVSKSQADKLGDFLREGRINAEVLERLNEYRASFSPAYSFVERVLKETLALRGVAGRPSKSTIAIVEKLKRETIRLTQIQDIAGCRFLVRSLSDQDGLAERAAFWMPNTEFDDRRLRPSHGYRALHLIAPFNDRHVEIQIRTRYQHAWAEISEKLADKYGQEVKYGKGPDIVQEFLVKLSTAIQEMDIAYDSRLRHSDETLRLRASRGGAGRLAQKKLKELSLEHTRAMSKANRIVREFGELQ